MIIYVLRNRVNGKAYVGQTIQSLEARWTKHVCLAKTSGYAIHRAIRKYGVDSFDRSVIASASDAAELNRLEREYIAALNTFGENGYNQTIGGDGVMHRQRHSEETRRRIAAVQIGRKQSPEAIAKRIAHQIGRPLSAAHRAKLSAWQVGKKLTPEHRAKLSTSHLGIKPSDETRAKRSASMRGRKQSPEHTARIREAHLKRAHLIRAERAGQQSLDI